MGCMSTDFMVAMTINEADDVPPWEEVLSRVREAVQVTLDELAKQHPNWFRRGGEPTA